MANKVRIGLLIDDIVLPAWLARIVTRILALDQVEIALVITASNKQQAQGKDSSLYHFYTAIDRRIYRSSPDPTTATGIGHLVQHIPGLQLVANPEKKDWLSEADLAIIKTCELQVLVNLSSVHISGAIIDIPRLGVWSMDCLPVHGTANVPAASAFINKEKITPAAVFILNNDPAKQQIIYRSFSMTDEKSINRNLNSNRWKSVSFIPRLLKLLAENGEAWFRQYVEQYQKPQQQPMQNRRVSSAKISGAVLSMAGREIGNRLRGLFYTDNWKLFYHTGADEHVETGVAAFKKISAPKGSFWADPHVVDHNGKPFVFFEAWDHAKHKGYIAAFEFTGDDKMPAAQKILEKPYHLSYPFTFEWAGVHYMIPETASNRTIELYRCTDFPGQWEFVMNLMEDVHAVDTTLYFYENRWWLFANMVEEKGASSLDELFVFYAADFLTTGWTAHKLNPVISDARTARPAGALFTAGDKLYRPSQCSDKIYGHGTNINIITRLTADDFAEEQVAMLLPGEQDNKCLGVHSYSKHKQLTVIDKFYRERK